MLCRNAGETIENQDSSVFDFDIILGLIQSSPSIQELAGITSSQAEILFIRRTIILALFYTMVVVMINMMD